MVLAQCDFRLLCQSLFGFVVATQPAGQSAYRSWPGVPAPPSGHVGQEKPGRFIAEISLYIGGWQAGTPRQDGSEEEAQSRTLQPHSLATAAPVNELPPAASPRTTIQHFIMLYSKRLH
jgi:hypothetical protein